MLQYRPVSGQHVGQQYYAPNRDVSFAGPGMVHLAMHLLEPENREPWFCAFAHANDVTEDGLTSGVELLADAIRRAPSCESMQIALAASGFVGLPPAVQVAIYCRIGQVMLAHMQAGQRDVKVAGQKAAPNVEETLAAIYQQLLWRKRSRWQKLADWVIALLHRPSEARK